MLLWPDILDALLNSFMFVKLMQFLLTAIGLGTFNKALPWMTFKAFRKKARIEREIKTFLFILILFVVNKNLAAKINIWRAENEATCINELKYTIVGLT